MIARYCDRCGQKITDDIYKVRFYGQSGDNKYGGMALKTAEINCYSNLVDDRDYCLNCLETIRNYAYQDVRKIHNTINELINCQGKQTNRIATSFLKRRDRTVGKV